MHSCASFCMDIKFQPSWVKISRDVISELYGKIIVSFVGKLLDILLVVFSILDFGHSMANNSFLF